MKEGPTIGRVTIDPGVLETIARLTTLAVPGVVRMTPPLGIQRLLRLEDGVQIAIREGIVNVDLYLVVESGRNLLALGRQIQSEVTRAIQDMVGMEVGAVNVHIEDVAPVFES
ncbi:MAG TPA: Asp23/Gls24 family envelope stress response protein [Anaerolineales bacterium]|nr:Asp23/Gls24 family envelope stress response protein [Anaerolineae bacterium]HIQ00515.1 Asp23/Gls24 family envelope stress response protein [Anaerolineales bacterium]